MRTMNLKADTLDHLSTVMEMIRKSDLPVHIDGFGVLNPKIITPSPNNKAPKPEEIVAMVEEWKTNNPIVKHEEEIVVKPRNPHKKIFLPGGVFTIIDKEDFQKVISVGEWVLSHKGYVVSFVHDEASTRKDKKKIVILHRLIMDAPNGLMVDHIDGDKTNNSKSNLRLCTNEQNGRNRGKPSVNTSGYKGVSWDQRYSRFKAGIVVNKNRIDLGYFVTAIEAAKAYNDAAIKYHGEFARLNEIP